MTATLPATATLAATATTPSSPPPLVHEIYASADGTYAVLYDPTWTVKPQTTTTITDAPIAGAVAISYDPHKALFLALPLTVTSKMSYSGFLIDFFHATQATNTKMTGTETTVPLPSGTWAVVSGSATIAGISSVITTYGIVHEERTFLIYTVTSSAEAPAEQATHLQPMLQSFGFLT
jgi:hypothetical protein